MQTGLSEVNSVSFDTSKFRENRVQAREMAMKIAREKAVAMAAAIGQTIGKAIYIQEGVGTGSSDFTNGIGISVNGNRGRSNNFLLEGQSQSQTISTTFAPGSIKVEATVTVVFLLN